MSPTKIEEDVEEGAHLADDDMSDEYALRHIFYSSDSDW